METFHKLAGQDQATVFEAMYVSAENNPAHVPWGGINANALLIQWLDFWGEERIVGKRALVIGCGLGGDAEELARRGYQVTAFDVSQTAVDWCRAMHPESDVNYIVGDLFAPPVDWEQAWDFVLDVQIVQAMPLSMRDSAISAETRLVAPGGHLLIITLQRDDAIIEPSGPPWPLSHHEIMGYNRHGLELSSITVLTTHSDHWRALFNRPKPVEEL